MVKMQELKQKCPSCGSANTEKYGFTITSRKGKRQRYHCRNCGKVFSI